MWFYLMFGLPVLFLGLLAKVWIYIVSSKYARINSQRNETAAEMARILLDLQGLADVRIEATDSSLGNYYHNRSKTVYLSPRMYHTSSLAALGAAVRPIGQAMQDADRYWGARVRSFTAPALQIGSWLGPILIVAGLIFLGELVTWIGLALFAAAAAVALLTLPSELDASTRARRLLDANNILSPDEMLAVSRVLNATSLTYVAITIQAITSLPSLLLANNRAYWHPGELEPSKK